MLPAAALPPLLILVLFVCFCAKIANQRTNNQLTPTVILVHETKGHECTDNVHQTIVLFCCIP
jgi:hypothetical protein